MSNNVAVMISPVTQPTIQTKLYHLTASVNNSGANGSSVIKKAAPKDFDGGVSL